MGGGGSAGDGIIPVASMTCLMNFDWPSLEDRRLVFRNFLKNYKIHSGTVSLDKDKYLTPAFRLRYMCSIHSTQDTCPIVMP